MKTMVLCDLICTRGIWKSSIGVAVFISLVIFISMGSIYMMIPCVTCSITVSLFYNILAFDEQHDWQRYRLVMPLSRRQTVRGRYVSGLIITASGLVLGIVLTLICIGVSFMLLDTSAGSFVRNVLLSAEPAGVFMSAVAGAGITMLMLALTAPLAMRSGLTKAIRLLPALFVLFIVVVISLGQGLMMQTSATAPFVIWLQSGVGAVVLGSTVLLLALGLYGISCLAAERFYARREL